MTMTLSWRFDARCKDDPGGIFDAAIDAVDTPDELAYPTAEHRRYCEPCPVRELCLAWAQEHQERGIWGGTTDYQRRQLRRPYSRRTCPACASDAVRPEGTDEVCLTCGMSWAAAA